ncbi:MAG: type II toxin-antitoxin system PemK/MazF family toxin [Clostridia bacterium]|nr:type II toxin-antitoxin system PemK/MazF family toxin [Clostridia bacterium]
MKVVQGNGFPICRGEVYQINLGQTKDHQELIRPVLVIQNDIGNSLYDSVIVVPLSPKIQTKRLFVSVGITPSEVPGLEEEHVALFFQIRTIDKSKISKEKFLGKIESATMWQVDEAIKLSLGISTIQRIQNRKKA